MAKSNLGEKNLTFAGYSLSLREVRTGTKTETMKEFCFLFLLCHWLVLSLLHYAVQKHQPRECAAHGRLGPYESIGSLEICLHRYVQYRYIW